MLGRCADTFNDVAHAGFKAVGQRQHCLAPLRLDTLPIGFPLANQRLLPLEFAAIRFERGCTPLVDFMGIGPENLHRAGHIANLVRAAAFGDLDSKISGGKRAHSLRHPRDRPGDQPLGQRAGEQGHEDAGC